MVGKMTNVTVVIPLYNKEEYIKRALHSVRSQTHQSFEIIVVNDGSTDGGLAKAGEVEDERIRIINQGNLGESAARNRGITDAKNKLIAFLDADDQWEPEFIANIVRIAEVYPDAGMIGTAYKIFKPDGKIKYPEFKYIPQKEGYIEDFFKAALIRNPVCSSTVVIRKEVFDTLGGFTEGMRYGPDSFMWSKIALNYPVVFINKYLVIINANIDNRVSKQYEVVNDFPLFEYFDSIDKEFDEEMYYYMKEYVYQKYLLIAARYLRTKDKRMAKLYIAKAKETKLNKRLYILGKLALYLPDPLLNVCIGIWGRIIN